MSAILPNILRSYEKISTLRAEFSDLIQKDAPRATFLLPWVRIRAMKREIIEPVKHVNQAIVERNSKPEGRIWASIASFINATVESCSEAIGDDSITSIALFI